MEGCIALYLMCWGWGRGTCRRFSSSRVGPSWVNEILQIAEFHSGDWMMRMAPATLQAGVGGDLEGWVLGKAGVC